MRAINITAETTDEDLLAPVYRAQRDLVTYLNNRMDGTSAAAADDVSRHANAIANALGRMRAKYEARNVLKSFAERGEGGTQVDDAVREHLTGLLMNGVDDTYSGRNNDARRSEHEGFVTAVREIVRGY